MAADAAVLPRRWKKSPSLPRCLAPASGWPSLQIPETYAVGGRYIECLAESDPALEMLARRDAVASPAPHLRRRVWPPVVHLQRSCPDVDIRLPATPDARQFLLPVLLPLWSWRKADKTSQRCVSGASWLRLLKQEPFHKSRHSSPILCLLL